MSSSDECNLFEKKRRRKRISKNKTPKKDSMNYATGKNLDTSLPSCSGYRSPSMAEKTPVDSDSDEFTMSSPRSVSPNGSPPRRKSVISLPASLRRKQKAKGLKISDMFYQPKRTPEQEEDSLARQERWCKVSRENRKILTPKHFKPYMSVSDNPVWCEFLEKKKNDPEFVRSLHERAEKAKPIKIFSDDEDKEEPAASLHQKDNAHNDTLVFDKSVDEMFMDMSDCDDKEFDEWCQDTKGKKVRSSWKGGPLPDASLGWNYDGVFDSDDPSADSDK